MLGEISFAGRRAYNIKCNDTKARILKDVADTYQTRIIQRHHERFSEAHVARLNANPYLVSLRTNGNPYLLYLTRINFVNQCIFIDKKIQQGYSAPRMIVARFAFDDALFDDTLLDGEMVVDEEGTWLFLVGDLIAHRGAYLENVNAVRRINMVYDIFKHQFAPDMFDVCQFQVKRYFHYEEMAEMLSSFVPQLKYTCRGIYFKPMYLKFADILYNFDDSLVKKVHRQKFASESMHFLENVGDVTAASTGAREDLAPDPPCPERAPPVSPPLSPPPPVVEPQKSARGTQGTRVFMARRTGMPDVYTMEAAHPPSRSGEPVVEIQACMPTLQASRLMRATFKDKNINERVAIVCEASDLFPGKWVPVALAHPPPPLKP